MKIHWIQGDVVSADPRVEQEEVAVVAQRTTLIVLSLIEVVVAFFHGIKLKEEKRTLCLCQCQRRAKHCVWVRFVFGPTLKEQMSGERGDERVRHIRQPLQRESNDSMNGEEGFKC